MKKRMMAILLVLCMVFAIMPVTAWAGDEGAVVYLNTSTGDDSKDGQSEATAVRTLDKALELAGEGGTIYLGSQVTITSEKNIENVNFARLDGYNGVLFSVSGSAAVLSLKNVTIDGGDVGDRTDNIVYLSSGATLNIGENAVLTRNDATAVSAMGGSTVNMTGGEISNNWESQNDGGAIYLWDSTANLTGGEIYNNYANRCGGGICSLGSSIVLDGTIIRDNTSQKGGGGVYFETTGKTGISFVMSSGEIVDNGTYGVKGGGLYAAKTYPDDSAQIKISGGKITGNKNFLGDEYEEETSILIGDFFEDATETTTFMNLELSGSPELSGEVVLLDWADYGPQIHVTDEFTPVNPIAVDDIYGTEGRIVVVFDENVTPNAEAFAWKEGSSTQLVLDGQNMKWSKFYTVTFNQVDSRENPEWHATKIMVPKGETIPVDQVPAAAEISGYERTAWQYYSGGKWVLWDMETPITSNTTLYEVWTAVAVTDVELDQTTLVLETGKTASLTATVVPENALNQGVTWASEDESIATVDEFGTVTAVAVGETKITVTTDDGAKTASCVVTVKTHEELCPSKNYTDLDVEAWYHEGVDFVIANGIMQGIEEGKFSPETNITRAQLAQILYNMTEEKEYTTDKTFPDVKQVDESNQSVWYYDAVMWAASKGIVTGYEDGTFQPDREVSRQEMVTMLKRYADFENVLTDEVTQTLEEFPDAEETWATDAFAWAVQNGIIDGKDGKLAPADMTRRCEIAKVIMVFCQAIE